MENWFREAGRPALVDALSEVCGRLEQDFTARAQSEAQGKTNIETEHHLLRVRAANVDRLEEQIQTLERELAQLRRSTQSTPLDSSRPPASPRKSQHPPRQHSRAPLTPVSANQNIRKSVKGDHSKIESLSHAELLGEYLKLDERHEKLRIQAADSVKANGRLQERLRQQKDSLSRWKEHAAALQEQNEKQQTKIKHLKAKGAATANTSATNSSLSPDTDIVAPDAPVRAGHCLRNGVYQPTEAPRARTNTPANHKQRESPLDSIEKPSHSLIGEPDGVHPQVADELPLPPMPAVRNSNQEVPIKTEPSSDTPVVVSERSVRKRRREDDQVVVDTPLASKVKIEDSSDPVVTDEQHQFVPHSSIDFDDRERLNPTPRRNRAPRPDTRLREDPVASPSTNSNSRQRGEIKHASNSSPSRDRRLLGRAPASECGQEQSHEYPDVAVASVSSAVIPEISSSGRLSNARGLDADTPNRKPRPGSHTPLELDQRIASLAEDGAPEDGTEPVRRQRQKTSLLDTLLHTATPEKSAIAAPSRLGRGARPPSPFEELVPRRQLDFRKNGRKQAAGLARPPETPPGKHTAPKIPGLDSSASKALDNSARPSKRGKDAVPLRERPQSELRPEDFKVNPKYNDGLDYAYTDVVRNKDERAHLSGCVQEACCGPWYRAEALRERATVSKSAFQANLEGHLGDDAWRLSTMSTEEKETMWVRERMQELANKYGKHNRHRFPRKSTPPGFFNPDFPSTQELIAGKEEGARVERGQVAERLREARKPNRTGLWLFRDE